METPSIIDRCINLVTVVDQDVKLITSLIREVRDSRNDLDLFSRELMSLKMLLQLLADDAKDNTKFPPEFQEQVAEIVSSSDILLEEIESCIKKHEGSSQEKVSYWCLHGQVQVNVLRISLEAHNAALELAVDLISLYVLSRQK